MRFLSSFRAKPGPGISGYPTTFRDREAPPWVYVASFSVTDLTGSDRDSFSRRVVYKIRQWGGVWPVSSLLSDYGGAWR